MTRATVSPSGFFFSFPLYFFQFSFFSACLLLMFLCLIAFFNLAVLFRKCSFERLCTRLLKLLHPLLRGLATPGEGRSDLWNPYPLCFTIFTNFFKLFSSMSVLFSSYCFPNKYTRMFGKHLCMSFKWYLYFMGSEIVFVLADGSPIKSNYNNNTLTIISTPVNCWLSVSSGSVRSPREKKTVNTIKLMMMMRMMKTTTNNDARSSRNSQP